MKINKHKTSKSTASLQNFDRLYKQAFIQLKNSSKKESFADVLNRKFVITKYPQQSQQLLAKTISKTIKDRKKGSIKSAVSRQSSISNSINQPKKQSQQFETEVLQSKRIKVVLTKKGQRGKPSSVQNQQKTRKKRIPYQTLPIISQVNFQSNRKILKRTSKDNLQLLKRANSKNRQTRNLSNIDYIMNDKNILGGWESSVQTRRNLQSHPFYQIQESNDLQYY